MNLPQWRRCGRVLASLAILALVSCSGCQAVREGTRTAFDEARAATAAWWEASGKQAAKDLAKEAASEASAAALAAGKTYADGKAAESAARLKEYGVDAAEVKDLSTALKAYLAVQAKEKESGKPYSGNALLDIAIALFLARYAGKGVDTAAKKLLAPMPPAKT